MTLMVALVGEQTLPNFLPIRHYKPDSVLLIYTARTKDIYNKLHAVLKQETAIFGLETSAYDIVSITQALKDKLAIPELASQEAEFNLTGGTKPMSLAAYQVAQQLKAPVLYLESENKQSYVYRYQWRQQQLTSPEKELLPECVKLVDFFNLSLGPGNWKEFGPPNDDGGLFEKLLAQALHLPEYEIMTGVKAFEKQMDIDITVRYGNQFGIIEAKAGKDGRKLDGIKQLNNAFRHLGTYTQLFYIITVKPSSSHQEIAKASHVSFVELKQYALGDEILSATDTKKIVDTLKQALKG